MGFLQIFEKKLGKYGIENRKKKSLLDEWPIMRANIANLSRK